MTPRLKPVRYSVTWRGRHPDDWSGLSIEDFVEATTAERAIAKVRKVIGEQYEIKRKDDIIIMEVRIND